MGHRAAAGRTGGEPGRRGDGPALRALDFAVHVRHGPEVLAGADTVIIPPFAISGPATPVTPDGRLVPATTQALARITPGTRIVSICTGAFVLAAAGWLDGRPVTTHWRQTDRLRRLFPRVKVDPDVLFLDDGDILTSAGAASGVDLCLHLVRKGHGSEVANQVARKCVVPPWRDGGQAQYIDRPVPAPSSGGPARAREWALARLHLPVTLAELAAEARMSGRTFARRFRAETGLSPGRWLIQQRVERARRLLESTDLPVDRIASEVGFGTAASLRQHLNAAIGVSPATYRRTFRPPLAG
ncbi:AraC family transcriptional regulator [Spongiactinospora gelatinilytica]|uniref:AraC family transcriptional regulator n=1 Tax=Spongiactinospora gelatinilytica TaxID=2666298 RepID=A0A2W2IXS1_9ACTN|nr:AraC family transcriptional regulator [Spongiactinospora gelatinilytica]